MGSLQSLALGGLVRRISWFAVTFAALGLGFVAGITVVLLLGTVLAPLEQSNRDACVAFVYGIAAAFGGLVASAIQMPLPRGRRGKAPWLLGNTIGAPLVLPALHILVRAANVSAGLPLWLIGLGGGLGFSLASRIGLLRSIAPPPVRRNPREA